MEPVTSPGPLAPTSWADAVAAAASRAGASGPVDAAVRPVPDRPGWWSSPVALRLASPLGMPVARLAELLAGDLDRTADEGARSVGVVGPGYLHVDLGPGATADVLARAAVGDPAYGMEVVGPPERWVRAAADLPRTLRRPANPVLLVQLAHSRLAWLPRVDAVGDDALRWDVAGLVWDFPAAARRGSDGLARLLEDAAQLGLEPQRLDGLSVGALRAVLAGGLRLLNTAAPHRI